MKRKLTHVDEQGQAHMVDISQKDESQRIAIAEAILSTQADTLRIIQEGNSKKGDVLATARIAAMMGAKQTAQLIPLCHPIALDHISITFSFGEKTLTITASATTRAKTGVEMEALTAATIASLTIYDMVKAIDRAMVIQQIRLLEKSGGNSGTWQRPSD